MNKINSSREVASVSISNEIEPIAAQGKDLNFNATDVLNRGRQLAAEDIKKLANTQSIRLVSARILNSNDSSFEYKLKMINEARKEIRLVYYIYSNDDSSSKLNKALIQAAQRGVKVTLLADFITNYSKFDLFSMLESEGNKGSGSLKTYFYNIPAAQIIADANYIVLPCSKSEKVNESTKSYEACYQEKTRILTSLKDKYAPSAFAKIFLSGLYGKNPTLLKVALGYGAQINPADYKSDEPMSEEDKASLIEFAKTSFDAFIKDDILAKIKLALAMHLYGDKLSPIINEVTGRLPLKSIYQNEFHGKTWDHITDFTHHKLLATDANQFLLGGRNIEDSYHMKQRVGLAGKYIFIDTDFWGKTENNGAASIEKKFDDLLNSSLVASLEKVKSIIPNDLLANTVKENKTDISATEQAVGQCAQMQTKDLAQCLSEKLPKTPKFRSLQTRLNEQVSKMESAVQRYDTLYTNSMKERNAYPEVDTNQLQDIEAFYIENINYDKKMKKRIIGSKIGSEFENGKSIHGIWYREMENACRISRDPRNGYSEQNALRIIFHSAYLLMPSGLVHQLGKMMNNDYGDCSKVKIQFLTNSPETTDLAPVNLLARYQLIPIFNHYAQLVQYEKDFNKSGIKYKRFFPSLEYYEYKKADGAGESLHSKVTVFGNNIMIGSANGDVRSYFMDTNNAILVRNAPALTNPYIRFVDQLIHSGRVEYKLNQFAGRSRESLQKENQYLVSAAINKYRMQKHATESRVKHILDSMDKLGDKIINTTRKMILYKSDFSQAETYNNQDTFKVNKELNELANSYDNMFKLF